MGAFHFKAMQILINSYDELYRKSIDFFSIDDHIDLT